MPSPLVGSGVPPSPPRLGCSLRSHRPAARAALAHRCQPTAGVFVGWRSAATMAVVAIAQGLRRLLLSCWGRVLCILLARDSCCASAWLPLGRSHQLTGRTLNGAWLMPPLRYGAGLSTTARGGLLRGRASPLSLLAYRAGSRVSAPWSLTRLPALCSSLVGSPVCLLCCAGRQTGEPPLSGGALPLARPFRL